MSISGVRSLFLLIILGSSLTSCVSNRKLTERSIYFRNMSDSIVQQVRMQYEPRIQKGDILYIGVITPNEKSSQLFNQPNFYAGSERIAGGGGGTASGPTQGYLVAENGSIIFPLLGQLQVAGMTKLSLSDTLRNMLKQYIDSAIVSVRLLNYRVTVLGEVMRPGTFSIPSERVTILDAIGLAGDLTVYGRRNNIRVIRNTDDTVRTASIDLNEGNVFESPYFFLQPNDIVYVEMNERKIPNTDMADFRRLSMGLSILSALGVIIGIVNVIN